MGTTEEEPDAWSNAVGAAGRLESGRRGEREGRRPQPGPPAPSTPQDARFGQPPFPRRHSTARCTQAKPASPWREAAWGLAVSHSHLSANEPRRLRQAWRRWRVAEMQTCVSPPPYNQALSTYWCLLQAECLDTQRAPSLRGHQAPKPSLQGENLAKQRGGEAFRGHT